jgi:hypothetical protein
MSRKRNPYVRIIEAAKRGVGVKLSAEEVHYLAQDSAIETAAFNSSQGMECGGADYRVTLAGFEEKDA